MSSEQQVEETWVDAYERWAGGLIVVPPPEAAFEAGWCFGRSAATVLDIVRAYPLGADYRLDEAIDKSEGIMAAHDAEVAAKALRKAADEFDSNVGIEDLDDELRAHGTPWTGASVEAAHANSGAITDGLRARADKIEGGA